MLMRKAHESLTFLYNRRIIAHLKSSQGRWSPEKKRAVCEPEARARPYTEAAWNSLLPSPVSLPMMPVIQCLRGQWASPCSSSVCCPGGTWRTSLASCDFCSCCAGPAGIAWPPLNFVGSCLGGSWGKSRMNGRWLFCSAISSVFCPEFLWFWEWPHNR